MMVKVTCNIAQYLLRHVTYIRASLKLLHPMVLEEMHLQENTIFLPLTLMSQLQKKLTGTLYVM